MYAMWSEVVMVRASVLRSRGCTFWLRDVPLSYNNSG